MADVKILEKAQTSFFQEDDFVFINQNNALRQVPGKILAKMVGKFVPLATPDEAGLITAQDQKTLNELKKHHDGGIVPAYKLDYAGKTAAGVAADLLTYIKDLPGGATRKINLGVGNVSIFVGYWNNNDDTNILTAGEWSALEIIGVCRDVEKLYCKLRLTTYNTNKTYESILNASVFSPWVEMVNIETMAKYVAIAGEFKWYAGGAVPSGYLLCNGALINRQTYAALFAAIGTRYGAGDGSTTFALPNLIGRFIEGGAAAGTYIGAGLPNIYGQIGFGYRCGNYDSLRLANGAFAGLGNGSCEHSGNGGAASALATADFNAARSSGIYGASSTVQPPALTMLPIIKY